MPEELSKSQTTWKVSKSINKINNIHRGGIAVVWLGKRDGQDFAMKQFPKQSGNKVDPSAYVEMQIH